MKAAFIIHDKDKEEIIVLLNSTRLLFENCELYATVTTKPKGTVNFAKIIQKDIDKAKKLYQKACQEKSR